MAKIINAEAISRRIHWVQKIKTMDGDFTSDFEQLTNELNAEISSYGLSVILDHLRLCGDIPESYTHDSSEEKLYSKYTDSLLCESYKAIGMKSLVLKERGDTADVEAFAKKFSFVADAKSFRLSRTAKNQKDFKVQAMDGWKRGKPYAMVVCPMHQLPTRSSQIYEQASSRNVCIFTYSHLAMIVAFSAIEGKDKAEKLLHIIFKTISALNPSKDASSYWLAINRTILEFSKHLSPLWHDEKSATIESLMVAKEEALTFLATEREKIMRMSHEQALKELMLVHRIDSRINAIKSFSGNDILGIV